jgi:hypothetical protein
MSLLITPESCRAMYEYLSLTRPFINWNMRDADDVRFVVVKDRALHGYFKTFYPPDRSVEIGISSSRVGSTNLLAKKVAHEKLHLHLYDTGVDMRGRHGRAWRACALEICTEHGWDHLDF